MRYLVIAVLIIIGSFVVIQLQSVDQALASADNSLRTVSQWAGNPPVLIDLRSQLHTYRYSRAQPPVALKLRIMRQGEPGRVIPPASNRYGVLGPNQPLTMPSNAAAVNYKDGFEQPVPRNEMQNLAPWDNEFQGGVNHDVARDWLGYTVWGEPTLDGEFTSIRSGDWSQKISGYATWRAGILRPFKSVRGAMFAVNVWGHLHIIGGGAVRVGVDPTGGTDPNAATVIWSPQYTTLGQWMQMPVTGQALADTITVFLEGFSVFDDNTNVYFDDFQLDTFYVA